MTPALVSPTRNSRSRAQTWKNTIENQHFFAHVVPEASWFFKNGHLATDVPKKVEKTSSGNITSENSVHPYRNCGSGGSCGMISKLFPVRCFSKILTIWSPRSKSFVCRVLPTQIDENRCTIVQNRWNSMHFISKTTIWLRTSPKKSKKRQAKTLLLQIRCTPIALPAPRPEPLIFRVPPLCLIFDPKPIIPLRTSLKKSKKRQAKTSLLKIRCTPIALAALAALAA